MQVGDCNAMIDLLVNRKEPTSGCILLTFSRTESGEPWHVGIARSPNPRYTEMSLWWCTDNHSTQKFKVNN